MYQTLLFRARCEIEPDVADGRLALPAEEFAGFGVEGEVHVEDAGARFLGRGDVTIAQDCVGPFLVFLARTPEQLVDGGQLGTRGGNLRGGDGGFDLLFGFIDLAAAEPKDTAKK